MADKHDASLTVSAYSQKFFQSYSDSIEPTSENANNKRLAGQTFINLVKKLHEAGSKDDLKVPLRVLRDEIGRIYFGSVQQRDLRIEKLFQLYDALEEGAQEELRSKSAKESVWAQQALEELRQRFSRLVIGDTWETYPELKLKALQHMHQYMIKEKADKPTPTTPARQGPALSGNRLGMKKLSRSFSGSTQTTTTWQSTFDDLAKAPGSRLMPLIKLLLGQAKVPTEISQEPASVPGTPGTPVNETQHKDPLRTQPSGISEGGLGRPMSELDINMDDLLGLNDSPFEAAKTDPFRVSSDGPPTAVSSTQQQQHQQQQPQQQPQQLQKLQPPPEAAQQTFNPTTVNAPPQGPAYQAQRQQGLQNGAPSYGHVRQTPPEANAYGQVPAQPVYNPGAQLTSYGSGQFVKVPKQLGPIGTAGSNPGSFNPFDLPSPTYASPVPKHMDNSFAEFSPVAGAPLQPKIPNPMRTPPEPPKKASSPNKGPQPPTSSFSSW